MNVAAMYDRELYFLAPCVEDAARKHRGVIEPVLCANRGPDWLEKLGKAVGEYRAAYEKRLKEEEEARRAIERSTRCARRLRKWRKYMRGVAELADEPDVQQRLAKAAGVGLGSPRTARELRDFFDVVQPMVTTFGERFRALGATESAMAFVAAAQLEVNECLASAMKERAEESASEDLVSAQRSALRVMLRAVDRAVDAAVARAGFDEDEAALEEAEASRVALDTAETEMTRVRQRRRGRKAEGTA